MATGVEITGLVIAGSAPASVAIAFLLRPFRHLLKDLAPLTARDSDGITVFDEMRTQQKADSVALQHLAAEFPKNGIPARSAVDALSLKIAEIQVAAADTRIDVAEVRAAQEAHVRLHLAVSPQTDSQRARNRRAAENDRLRSVP